MLTPSQIVTLKAYILADPVLSTKVSGEGTDLGFIAQALSAPASPVVLAWRPSVPPQDSDEAADYTIFDSIVAGKRESWGFFLNFNRDPRHGKVRKWVTDIWGSATAGSASEAILQAMTENALRAEAVIGGTTKTTGTVSAIDRNFVGTISIQDVSMILL